MNKTFFDDTLIIIPARRNSTRLLHKALALIGNLPMVIHTMQNAQESGICDVYVATDCQEILEIVENAGGKGILTSHAHESGTDRVHEAVNIIDPQGKIKFVVNLQGDLPLINSEHLTKLVFNLRQTSFDMNTLYAKSELEDAFLTSKVKIAKTKNNKALYFSRNPIPYGTDEFLFHIGIYGFQRDALEKFVKFPVSELEKYEQLEQLRALDNGMEIGLLEVDSFPISVDTLEDLNAARKIYFSLVNQ